MLYAAAWLMAEGGRGGQTTEAARTSYSRSDEATSGEIKGR